MFFVFTTHHFLSERIQTEKVGFEPTVDYSTPVFKTDTLNPSATFPSVYLREKRDSNPQLLAWQTNTLTCWVISPIFLNLILYPYPLQLFLKYHGLREYDVDDPTIWSLHKITDIYTIGNFFIELQLSVYLLPETKNTFEILETLSQVSKEFKISLENMLQYLFEAFVFIEKKNYFP